MAHINPGNRQSDHGVAYDFWVYVEEVRAQRSMSKRRLAQVSGVPASTLDRLETQTRPPQPRIVNALIEALGLEKDKAYRLAGVGAQPQEDRDRGEPQTVDELREHVAANERLTPRQRRIVLDMIAEFTRANDTPNGDEDSGQEQAI